MFGLPTVTVEGVGIWVAALLTLAVLSAAGGENRVSRIALALLVGGAVGPTTVAPHWQYDPTMYHSQDPHSRNSICPLTAPGLGGAVDASQPPEHAADRTQRAPPPCVPSFQIQASNPQTAPRRVLHSE